MRTNLLEEIGLTEGETKVYLTLSKLGLTKTGPLSIKAGVSSSKVYKILDRLQKKGLAGHVMKGGIKYFKATEPRRIIDYIEEKEKQLDTKKKLVEKMIPELILQQKKAGKITEVTLYDGFKAVTNFFRNILDELKKGETYYVIGGGYGDNIPGIKPFFQAHHKRRAQLKIKVKMLANHDIKKNIVKTTSLISEIKFLPQYLITNMEIVFYKNKTFVVIWTEEPKGILIESEEAMKSFQSYFNAFWKIAKK